LSNQIIFHPRKLTCVTSIGNVPMECYKRERSNGRQSYSLDCAYAPDVKWDSAAASASKGYSNCSTTNLLNFQVRSLPAKDPTLQSQRNGFPISISTAEGSDKKNWGNDGLVWCKELATSNNNCADMTQSMGMGVLRPKANTGFLGDSSRILSSSSCG
jgi:hypothetical protein